MGRRTRARRVRNATRASAAAKYSAQRPRHGPAAAPGAPAARGCTYPGAHRVRTPPCRHLPVENLDAKRQGEGPHNLERLAATPKWCTMCWHLHGTFSGASSRAGVREAGWCCPVFVPGNAASWLCPERTFGNARRAGSGARGAADPHATIGSKTRNVGDSADLSGRWISSVGCLSVGRAARRASLAEPPLCMPSNDPPEERSCV